jgi:hypothetical protein
LYKLVRARYGNSKSIKLIQEEEERVGKFAEEKIREFAKQEVVLNPNNNSEYNPIKGHLYFKISYIYLKKVLSTWILI